MARGKTTKANRSKFVGVAAVLAVFIAAVDQISKNWALDALAPYQPTEVWPPLISFVLVFNKNAAFSIGGGQTWLFTVISAVAAILIAALLRRIESTSWAILAGLLLGGVVGNLIDRLTREPGFGTGQVVDFIQIPFNFPIFNIADSAISIVATVTVIRLFRGHRIGKASGTSSTKRGAKR